MMSKTKCSKGGIPLRIGVRQHDSSKAENNRTNRNIQKYCFRHLIVFHVRKTSGQGHVNVLLEKT
jgi:hypothetical protein